MKKINILALSSLALTSLPILMTTISCSANTTNSSTNTPVEENPIVPSEKPNTPDNLPVTPDPVTPEKFSNEDEFLGELIDRYYKSLNSDLVRDKRVPVIAYSGNRYKVTLETNTTLPNEVMETISEETIKELFPNGYEIQE